MKSFRWNIEKNELLKFERGISFEAVVVARTTIISVVVVVMVAAAVVEALAADVAEVMNILKSQYMVYIY